MKKLILLFFLLVSIGCSQTIKIPFSVIWDYDYGSDNPSTIYFEVFQNIAKSDTNYIKIDSTYNKELRLLDYENLYTGNIRYLFCRAHRKTDDALSFNSDTISSRFPVILMNQPFEFIQQYMDLKK